MSGNKKHHDDDDKHHDDDDKHHDDDDKHHDDDHDDDDHDDDDHDDDDHDDDDHDDDDHDDDDDNPPCFMRGTYIRTDKGEVLVEDLLAGDMVWTKSHGYQPIRWVFQREVSAEGRFAPIRIRAGALGTNRDLLVSPAHRMLLAGPELEMLFGFDEAFVAAKDLVNGRTIIQETSFETVEYFHLLFDQHEVLEAHGTLSESFFPHEKAIGNFGVEQKEELFALFPEMEFGCAGFDVAVPSLLPHEIPLLARC